jgi:hypothetical protein
VYFLSVPVERCLTETPGGFHTSEAQPWWKVYARAAEKILARRAVQKDHPLLGISEHPLSQTERAIVAINYSPEPLETVVTLAQGWQAGAAWRGQVQPEGPGFLLSLAPNDAAVFQITKEGR